MAQLVMLIHLHSGIILNTSLNDDGESIGKTIGDMLTQYITEHGRPASIAVPDERTGDYVSDFAGKLGVELIEDQSLSACIKKVIGMMAERLGVN